MSESLGSVRNAVRVLKAFSSKRRDYGVTELARTLGLTTSTVHRILRTLQAEHLVEQDPQNGRYRLGLAVYDLVAASSPGYDLSEAVLPPMTMLRARVGETIQLAVLDGREVVYVERLQSMHSLRMFLDVGRRNWAHSTSTGKVLLAHLDVPTLERTLTGWELPAITGNTVTDVAVLRAQLSQIRHQGWAHNRDESEIGATSIGAPVRDVSGQVVAALSVVGPSPRMEQDVTAIRQAVVEAAAVASRRLGHRGRAIEHAG